MLAKKAKIISMETFFLSFLYLYFCQTSLDDLVNTLESCFFATLSTYALSIYHVLFLKVGKSFITFNLRVVRISYVQETLECKICFLLQNL